MYTSRVTFVWNNMEKILDSLCDKALLVDSMHNGVRRTIIDIQGKSIEENE